MKIKSVFYDEVIEVKNHFLFWFFSFLVVIFAVFSIGLSRTQILDRHIYLPVLSERSLAVIFFENIRNHLVPKEVSLVATSPTAAFVSSVKVSILLSFIITLPILLYEIFRYISPAFNNKEKKKILKVLAPSTILFLAGVAFSYFLLIPPTFRVLYSFNSLLGVSSFFAVDEFINWTLAIMFSTGIMFLLPVLMFFINWLNILPSGFWSDNWLVALAVFLIISAIITPDGSGVTMILLCVPMTVLYMIGAIIGARGVRKNL